MNYIGWESEATLQSSIMRGMIPLVRLVSLWWWGKGREGRSLALPMIEGKGRKCYHTHALWWERMGNLVLSTGYRISKRDSNYTLCKLKHSQQISHNILSKLPTLSVSQHRKIVAIFISRHLPGPYNRWRSIRAWLYFTSWFSFLSCKDS